MHVKGFTQLHPGVGVKQRGTFAGLKGEVIEYIKSLGVTSVELLPIHTFINDSHLLARGLTNYWGYNSIGFFAPTRATPRRDLWSCSDWYLTNSPASLDCRCEKWPTRLM
jgi:pullulanase/glycogen debranching enzyme